MRRHLVATRHAGLLIGISMRQELASSGDHEGVTLLTNPNSIDHAPEFFEIQSADKPSSVRVVIQAHGDDRRRQQIVIEGEVRHQRALDVDPFGSRNAGS